MWQLPVFCFFFKKYFLPVSITNKTAPALVFACVVLLSVRSQLAVNWIPTNLFQTHCFALCLPELESLQRFSAEFLKYICAFFCFCPVCKDLSKPDGSHLQRADGPVHPDSDWWHLAGTQTEPLTWDKWNMHVQTYYLYICRQRYWDSCSLYRGCEWFTGHIALPSHRQTCDLGFRSTLSLAKFLEKLK